jgi:hypothetical protein
LIFGGQRTDRVRKTDDRGRVTEDRGQKTEDGSKRQVVEGK